VAEAQRHLEATKREAPKSARIAEDLNNQINANNFTRRIDHGLRGRKQP
jgi:hypothetical protein